MKTAPRPLPRRARALAAALAGALALHAAAAVAQLRRPIPDAVDVGRLQVGIFPEASLDGRAVRLGPGTRIYDQNNLIRPPGSLSGEHRVAYARGTLGEINQVWLLSDTEYREISARIAAAKRAAAQR